MFERDPHPEIAPRFNPDRSYTIDISGHGLKALRHIDAWSDIRNYAQNMRDPERNWSAAPFEPKNSGKLMNVEDVMTRDVVTLAPEQTLRDAIEMLRRERIRHLPVVEGQKLLGIVTDRDVKRATPSVLTGVEKDEYDNSLQTIKVAQLMTREPITVAGRSPLKKAVEIFINARVGALPVVEDGHLVGIITDIDILRVAYSLLTD